MKTLTNILWQQAPNDQTPKHWNKRTDTTEFCLKSLVSVSGTKQLVCGPTEVLLSHE